MTQSYYPKTSNYEYFHRWTDYGITVDNANLWNTGPGVYNQVDHYIVRTNTRIYVNFVRATVGSSKDSKQTQPEVFFTVEANDSHSLMASPWLEGTGGSTYAYRFVGISFYK